MYHDSKETGSLTTTSSTPVRIHSPGMATVGCQLSGTFVGTVTFEGSVNGTDFIALKATAQADGAKATTATAVGIFLIPAAGLSYVRARCSAYTSGTIAVALVATTAPIQNANYTA